MKNPKKIVSAVFLILLTSLVIVAFSGCQDVKPYVPAVIEDAVAQIAEQDKSETVETPDAHFYFDNTGSMVGYSGANTNFLKVAGTLADFVSGYSDGSTLHALRKTNNVFDWSEFKRSEFRPGDEDFYFGHGGDNANAVYSPNIVNHAAMQCLFGNGEDKISLEGINVFMTDLIEADIVQSDFATVLHDLMLNGYDGVDYSIALFGLRSYYGGAAYVGYSSSMKSFTYPHYNDQKPFYVLISGPTGNLNSFCSALAENLEKKGLVNGQDFNYSMILSYGGLSYNNPVALVTKCFNVDDASNDTTDYGRDVTTANTGMNYNFLRTSNDDMFEDVGQNYPGFCYNYSTCSSPKKDTFGTAFVNLLLPLKDLTDGSPADADIVEYSLGTPEIYGAYLADMPVDEDGKPLVTEAASTETTAEYEDEEEADFDTAELYAWEKLKNYDLLESANAYMNIGYELYKTDDIVPRVAGLDPNGSFYEDLSDDKDISSPEEWNTLYAVDNQSGAMKIRIGFNDITDEKFDIYDYVTVKVPVLATKVAGVEVPQWITDWNLDVVSAGSPNYDEPEKSKDYVYKTPDLLLFYRLLSGISEIPTNNGSDSVSRTVSDVIVTFKTKEG